MFRQGIKGKYLHKHATFLWLSLCLAFFLSFLPQKALFDRNIFSCSHELDQSLQPVQTQIGTNDSIPFSGWVLSAGKEGQPLSFLSRIRVSNRIPFRLPIPELWFSVWYDTYIIKTEKPTVRSFSDFIEVGKGGRNHDICN